MKKKRRHINYYDDYARNRVRWHNTAAAIGALLSVLYTIAKWLYSVLS